MHFSKILFFLFLALCFSPSFSQGISGDTVTRPSWKNQQLNGKVKTVQRTTYYKLDDLSIDPAYSDPALTEDNATSTSISLQKYNKAGYLYREIYGSYINDTTDAVRTAYIYSPDYLLLRKEERNPSLSIYHKYEYTYEEKKLTSMSEYIVQGMTKYIQWIYNENGQLTEKKEFHTEKDYMHSLYTYDADGKLIGMKKSKTDDEHRKWSYVYKYKDDLLIRDSYRLGSDSSITSYAYDSEKHLILYSYFSYYSYDKKYHQNFRITKSYNENGLIAEHKHHDENDSLKGHVLYKYDDKNRLIEEESHNIPFGHERITKFEYDEKDNWIRKYSYDLNGVLKGKEERVIEYY